MRRLFVVFLIFAVVLSVTGCAAAPSGKGESSYFGDVAFKPEAAPGASTSMESPDISSDKDENYQITPGMLTAGEWKDAENLDFWKNVLNHNDWYAMMEARQLFPNKIIPVLVKDAAGNGCFQVPVSLYGNDGSVLYEAVTDVYGYAYLLHSLDGEEQIPTSVRVYSKDYPIAEGVTEILATDGGFTVRNLDLMLMVDTTGSMGDELKYLQKELEDVIERVAQAGEALSIHISVNFYRDVGDEYLIRDFDFTADISAAVRNLKKQDAQGGGDTPEAVHHALDNIVFDHQWREDSVKLCFFVLDAPPHKEAEIQGIDQAMRKTVMQAAKMGIRIIPVASSGVDTETEFLLRAWALMTGGTYTFLTDHSGIGNDHLEPTIGEYEVEALNECLIRIICEYCGLSYTKSGNNQ